MGQIVGCCQNWLLIGIPFPSMFSSSFTSRPTPLQLFSSSPFLPTIWPNQVLKLINWIRMKCHWRNEPSRLEIDTCCTHFTLHLDWPTQLNKSNSTALFVSSTSSTVCQNMNVQFGILLNPSPQKKDGKERKKENGWRWKELQFRLVSQGKRSWSLRVF